MLDWLRLLFMVLTLDRVNLLDDVALLSSLLTTLQEHVRAGLAASMLPVLRDPQLERQLPCQHSVVTNVLRCCGHDRDRLFQVLEEVTLGLEKARTIGVAMLLAPAVAC